MNRLRLFLIWGLALLSLSAAAAPRSEIRNGQWYVDNEPFYVRGVLYAPWRPHQRPGVSYTDTNRHWTETDFERIKAAHFNTLRTWEALDPEDLALAKKYGLMVLQGIRLDPKQDFSDPHNQDACVAQVAKIAEQSKEFDNILGYLVMREPSPQAVLDTGEDETLQFFRKLKRAIQNIDPRPVSMNSWIPLAFMDPGDFDFTTFNAFAFWPKSINYALGYAGYNAWLVAHFASDRPLIIGETGGYAVSQATVTESGGSGGWNEYQQSIKDLDSLRESVEGGAAGSVLASWIDTWNYPSDPEHHDNEPWEWDGILAIPTDSQKDMEGIPRQIFQDVAHYNQATILEPKANHIYPVLTAIPIQAFGADDVAAMSYSLNEGDWQPLEGSGHGWFHGFFKLPKLARKRQRLMVRALDSNDAVLEKKEISFLTAVEPEKVTIEPVVVKGTNQGQPFVVHVSDGKHQPIAGRKVYYGFFYPLTLREMQGMQITGANGDITITNSIAPKTEDAYVYVCAGTDSPERVRAGDMRIFSIGKSRE